MRRWLVDTGPFVAFLDRSDAHHAAVSECLEGFSGRLVTTSAVVTEVMHFISDTTEGPVAFAALLTRARVQVADYTQPHDVVVATALMKKYADTPMDFADATLVQAADSHGIIDILTLDRRGFSTYRTTRGKPFRLVLDG